MMASAGNRRLKVLFFSQRYPYPMDTGGKIRTGKTLEYLRNIFDVTLISNIELAKDQDYVGFAKNLCAEFHPVPWKELRKYSIGFYLKVLLRSFSRFPVTVINDYSKNLEGILQRLLHQDKYDVVVCDFLQPSINCLSVKGIPMVLFQHNVEAVIPRRHFEVARDPVSKFFWWLQWKKMQRYEGMACRHFQAVVAVSDKDKRHFEAEYKATNVYAIPTGVDTSYFVPPGRPANGNTLVFTGSMDWLPNEDGIIFFVSEILGRIKQRLPDIKFAVVGRNPSRKLLKALGPYPEVEVVGRVEDIREYIARYAVYVIPLRIGGGTRIKAYEAMAMGQAIISTTIGVEGLPVKDGEHLILADSPEDFADATIMLLENPERRRRLGKAARDYVEANFGWDKAGEVFADVCRKVAR